jgi:hypothetical protein
MIWQKRNETRRRAVLGTLLRLQRVYGGRCGDSSSLNGLLPSGGKVSLRGATISPFAPTSDQALTVIHCNPPSFCQTLTRSFLGI